MKMEATSEGLLGIRDLLTEAWTVYRRRLIPLVVVALAAAILPAAAFASIFGGSVLLAFSFPGLKAGITAGGVIMGVVAAVMVANWTFTAFLTAVVDESSNIKGAFTRSRPKFLGHLWLVLLTGLILTGAHLFFIIPGIILTVWFFFAPFVFMDEDVRGMNALLKSKSYVHGKWIPVAVRLFAVWLLAILVSAIPFVGQLAAFFMMPFSFVYTYLLYKNLKEIRGKTAFQPTRREKVSVVAAGALGYALPVVLVVAFMGSMLTMPFSMLTASITGPAPVSAPMDKPTAHSRIVRTQVPKKDVSTVSTKSNTDTVEHARILSQADQDWTKRSQAAFKLGLSKDSQTAVPPLMQALKTDNQWVVRKNAATALAKLQARDAVPLLMEVVGSDENVFVREAAAEALGRLGDKRAVTALKEALNDIGVVMTQKDGKTVEEKSVVKAAEKALAQLGADTEADPKAGQKQEELAQAKPDKDPADVTSQKASPAMPAKVKTAMADEEIDRLKARIQACTKALKIQPEDALAYHHRGLANFKLGNHDQAVQDLTKALDLNPGDATIYYNRAVVHADLGRYEEAIEDGTKSIKLDPDFADAYLNRGIDYLASGRIKEALADFEKLTELKTQDASGYYGRGIAKLKLGSHNPAIKDFKTAADMGNEKAKRYLKAVETSRSQS